MVLDVREIDIAVITERESVYPKLKNYLDGDATINVSHWTYSSALQTPPSDYPDFVVCDLKSVMDDVIPVAIHVSKSVAGNNTVYLCEQNNALLMRNWMRLLNRLGGQACLGADASAEQILFAVERLQAGIPALSVQPEMPLAWSRGSYRDQDEVDDWPLGKLSIRQIEILAVIAAGYTVREVAGRLHLSPRTVETHKYEMMKKLNCNSVVALCRFAIRHGIIRP